MTRSVAFPTFLSIRGLKAFAFLLALGVFAAALPGSVTVAQEAEWIWSPDHRKDTVPKSACHFRKSFTTRFPESAQVEIASDDAYDLYVNGTRVGAGKSVRRLDRYDISRQVRQGRNVIAIRVANNEGPTAALVARVQVKERNAGWRNFPSNKSWKTSLRSRALWNQIAFNDRGWKQAQSFGQLGSTEPWDRAPTVQNNEEVESHSRFRIAGEFRVQRVLDDAQCGSLIAMTINEFGQIIASEEEGPLKIGVDTNEDSIPDTMRDYCEDVKNCQGILALNGDVFVTGDGPDGNALYRLTDKDRDGIIDKVHTVLKFEGPVGEHGPHGLVLGPEGMLYLTIGNHSGLTKEKAYEKSSPHRHYYEGDLVQRYEDPGGHAVGVKVPGGVVIRTDLEGEKVELVAGGLRNAYDLAFNGNGDLFVHDSDMESDEGTPWYRPTQVFHVIAGGEFGWRSGWSKWPDYYVDNLPGIADTGRGSPTGAVAYNHFMFPKRYHNALFLADWSEGRILAVKMKRDGASYTADTEVFLEGQPLNVTDLEVGQDGALYFITGGRGTGGGMYRVSWNGNVPDEVKNLGEGMTTVIRQPQLQSAWARQNIARLKVQIGKDWERLLVGVARTEANPAQYRTRALDVMQLFGPVPSADLLLGLAQDKNELVRAKAAELMGLQSGKSTKLKLMQLVEDSDAGVRRKACESLARLEQDVSLSRLTLSLTCDDRHEVWAARRVLERTPIEEWRESVLTSDDQRLFIQGALALLAVQPNKDNSLAVLKRVGELMTEFVSDRDFVDLLRVSQLAFHRGGIKPNEVPAFRTQLLEEFPSGNSQMNRELARLMAYLQVGEITDRYIDYLASPDVPSVDKLHLSMYLRFIQTGWTSEQRLEMLRFYSDAIKWEGGGSYEHYVMNASRDFTRHIDDADVMLVVANGARWPHAALGALYKLPAKIDAQTLRFLKELERQLEEQNDDASTQLKVGIVAVLARSGDEQSIQLMREIWLKDPERREIVALGLAQHPNEENWDYLLRSIPVLEEQAAKEVLRKLKAINLRPEESEYYRQVILTGLKLEEDGADLAVGLLEHWSGDAHSKAGDSWEDALAAWQRWYADEFPDGQPAELPTATTESKWEFDELLEFLSGTEADGSADRGAEVYVKAQCGKCHRYGEKGERLGPDLTNLHKRFTRKEILQSILFPSHVISDQYASKTILTLDGRQHTGIVSTGVADEFIVLKSDGKKTVVLKDEVDELLPSKTSTMPEGLLNELEQEEIADLFEYLGMARRTAVSQRKKDSETK